MKSWEEMSNHERAEQTIKDIKLRQEKRERDRLEGIRQADNFRFNHINAAKKRKDNIRCKSYK